MRIHRFCAQRYVLCIGFIVALTSTFSSAQTIRLESVTLGTVPTGATAANPFWQHLVIKLDYNVSAGNVIQINLRDSVEFAHTDEDGDL